MSVQSLIMPKLGMYTDDVVLLEWRVDEGAAVEPGEVVFVLETEKTTAEVEAEQSGFLHRTVEAGAMVPIGGQVGVIAGSREEYDAVAAQAGANPFLSYIAAGGGETLVAPPVAAAISAEAGRAQPDSSTPSDPVPAARPGGILVSPRAFAALARHGLPRELASAIRGSGPGGRVLERDVLAHLARAVAPPRNEGVLERRPLRGRRGTIARRLVEGMQVSAQLTSVVEIDASPLVADRERLNGEGLTPRVSYTALVVALVGRALRRHPLLNSRVVDDQIELLADVNIGVAVDSADGLIVPVVHHADTLAIRDLNAAIVDLVARARAGKLNRADLEGGTFTVSNGGIYPVDITTAILNPPQCGLLWLGRIRERPIVIAGGIHVRPTVQACLTFDHRAIDGAPAAAFLGTLDELVSGLGAHA